MIEFQDAVLVQVLRCLVLWQSSEIPSTCHLESQIRPAAVRRLKPISSCRRSEAHDMLRKMAQKRRKEQAGAWKRSLKSSDG